MNTISKTCITQLVGTSLTPIELCQQLEELEFNYTMKLLEELHAGDSEMAHIYTLHELRTTLVASITD